MYRYGRCTDAARVPVFSCDVVCGVVVFLELSLVARQRAWVVLVARGAYSNLAASAYAPPPYYDGTPQAYYWLRHNTDPDAKIMSWWDYGYQVRYRMIRYGTVRNGTVRNGKVWPYGRVRNGTKRYSTERGCARSSAYFGCATTAGALYMFLAALRVFLAFIRDLSDVVVSVVHAGKRWYSIFLGV